MVVRVCVAAAMILGTTGALAPSIPSAAPTVLTVIAHDFAFTVPGGASAKVPAGPVTLRLVNQGKELHMTGVVWLGTTTVSEFLKSVETNSTLKGPSEVGGVNAVAPGETATATVILKPGHAALICWVVSTDGKLHALKGMIAPLEVVRPAGAVALEPHSDLAITLRNYTVSMQGPSIVRAGHHTFRVTNAGPLAHDVALFRMDAGADTADVDAWLYHPDVGSARAHPVGGSVGLDSGLHGWFSANLTPGNYVLLCLMPGEHDVPHFMGHHMLLKFHVVS